MHHQHTIGHHSYMPSHRAGAPSKAIFTAVVINSNAGSNAVTVSREVAATSKSGEPGNKLQGLVVSGCLSAFLGFKESLLPQPGCRVLCVEHTSSVCFVLGTIPQPRKEQDISMNARGTLGVGNAIADSSNRRGHEEHTPIIADNRRPTDIVDGEWGMSNEFGVLLGMFQQMAVLKASELSQVQCFLLDDLVRIISHNFQHYTALGEYNIYHDGKSLMAEFGATHKPAESYGHAATKNDSPSTEPFIAHGNHNVDDSSDFYDIVGDERIKAIERFKCFLGSCGDFLHAFLARPDDEETRILDPSSPPTTPDRGLFDIHLGVDGGLHVRSVKEIFLEKSTWIRVPQRVAAPDDPKGDDATNLSYDKKTPFAFDNGYTYKDNPLLHALQIRDYVAYVTEKLNYQNFKTHKKDFYVNDDPSKETSFKESDQLDQESQLLLDSYKLRTAGVYMMPNGGIVFRDAWNSAIIMEGGNIYIQPAKDLVTQPLRHAITKAGGSVSITGRKHIDLASTDEGIRLKAEKALYGFSNNSGIVLEANGYSDSPGNADSPEALDYIGGVLIKSNLGIYSYAQNNITLYSKGSVQVQAAKAVDIVADEGLTLLGKASAMLLSSNSLLLHSTTSTMVMSDMQSGIVGGDSTILGQKDQKLDITYPKDATFVAFPEGLLDVTVFKDDLDKLKAAKDKLLAQTIFGGEDLLDKVKFKFPSSDQYGFLDPQADGIPTTLAQQDDSLTGIYNLEAWEIKDVNKTFPYPGADNFDTFYYTVETPNNLDKDQQTPNSAIPKADSSSTPAKITTDSLNLYKVQPTT